MNIGLLPLLSDPSVFITVLVVLALSLAAHEMGHAFVADRLGDPTPRQFGRVTLNPIPHLSPIGILLLVLVGFGFASTPINPARLSRWGRVAVAAAGPLVNLLVAIGFILLFRFLPHNEAVTQAFKYIISINVLLAVINLLPIPLLDGSRILGGLVPSLGRSLDDFERQPYSFIVVFGVLYLLGSQINLLRINLTNVLLQIFG
ncbi:site-2 protease family protein [Deinococcus seoulensis]|uniref:Site-2 protease family protein n=1 Tax=Deinococcus seoulensis TaxID=1837379 RepID=A0ABQ2RTT9_9DEIO|nr:site-2 protease family protein [Deinococcus seoulensis]GGR55654.1 site-2 protease family protein [Deinococcus seoulensis]